MLQPDPHTPIPARQKKTHPTARRFLRVVAALALALAVHAFVAEPLRVEGISMQETLRHGEYMIALKLPYLLRDPARYDIVICNYPGRGQDLFVKRIVGIPGDTVAIRGGILHINGEPTTEPYVEHSPMRDFAEIQVEDGCYFVLGDNRPNSNDSRSSDVGLLTRDQIKARVSYVVWPLQGARAIE